MRLTGHSMNQHPFIIVFAYLLRMYIVFILKNCEWRLQRVQVLFSSKSRAGEPVNLIRTMIFYEINLLSYKKSIYN